VVAYRLALPTLLAGMHNVFHISLLKKYVPDPTHIIKWEQVQLSEDVTRVLRPTCILDRKEQELRNKVIQLVKVLWAHHTEEEATWETEAEVHKNGINFFFKGGRL
jgi:hypothetical protein